MLNLAGEYALRAMVYPAQHVADWPIYGKQIAEQAGIPAKYLSKVPGELVRAGALESLRGIGGGFRMSRPRKKIRLMNVLVPFLLPERR